MKILNFKIASTLFLLLLSFSTICRIFFCPCTDCFISGFCQSPWVFYLCLGVIYFGFSGVMAFFPSSGFHYREVFSRGSGDHRTLSLTFDDGIDPVNTPIILDILKKCNIKAAFFVIGKKIRGNEAILKRISGEGHIIGNHSWSHSNFWDFYSSGRMSREILQTDGEIEKNIGKKVRLFRPPYGVINPMVSRAIRNTGLKVVAWSFRSYDTTSGNADDLFQKTIQKASPGDIMLFHDTSSLTAGILEKIIVSLQEGGFTFISLDEMLKLQAYENR